MATNELQTKLNEILEDKNTNLLPENLKKDITCLGITGTFEGSGSSHEKVKIFNTVDEMNASTDNQDGDIALIYGVNPVEPNTTGFEANTLILPDKIPTNILNSDVTIENVEGDTFSVTFPAKYTEYGISFNASNGMGGSGIYVYIGTHYGATSEEYYERKYYQSESYGQYFYLNRYYTDHFNSDFTITKLKVSDATSPLWDYIKFGNIDTVEVYYYDSNTSKWKICNSSLSTNANNILKGNVVLGGKGLITGTLDLSSKKKIISMDAYSTSCYNGSDPTVVTIAAPDTYVSIDTTTVPEGLGDKRWLLVCTSFTMGMGDTSFSSAMYVLPDDKDVLYHVPYSTSGRYIGNIPDRDLSYNTKLSAYKVTGMNVIKEGNIQELVSLTSGTEIPSTLSSDTKLATYFGALGQTQLYALATNAEIRDVNENILVPAGPKASTTLKGQYYTNIFGEKVEGTKEVSEGGVKLFSTYDELTKSENNKENDLAIVYNTETSNITTDDKTYYITFPKTVTLPSAFTSDTNSYFNLKSYNSTDDETNQFSGSGYLSKTKFRVEMSEQTDIEAGQESKVVEYTSTDGLTYTRTTFNVSTLLNHEDMAVMGRYIKIITSDETFDTNLGYFMQIEKGPFKGLYMYRTSHWNLAPTQLNLELGTQLLKGYTGYGEGVVEGTYEPAPITSAEYDTAVTTATEIKGGE